MRGFRRPPEWGIEFHATGEGKRGRAEVVAIAGRGTISQFGSAEAGLGSSFGAEPSLRDARLRSLAFAPGPVWHPYMCAHMGHPPHKPMHVRL